MHKIKKGIKKKIKGKKGKHDDDEIFTEEELEAYKKQKAEEAERLAQQQQPEEPFDQPLEEETEYDFTEYPVVESQTASPPPEKGDEPDWKNFLASTDTVLKKTSDNLEHIKESSSIVHAKKPEEEVRNNFGIQLIDTHSQRPSACTSPVQTVASRDWVDLEHGGFDDEESTYVNYSEEPTVEKVPESPPPKKKFVELKPIEDLPEVSAEDYADVFDTAFVDNVESGDLKLIIPDSPVDEYSNEPDPFDTSAADKVLHIEEPEPEPESVPGSKVTLGTHEKVPAQPKKRKIQLVSLGNAVDVLTGKTAKQPSKETSKADEVNLLGEFTEINKKPTENLNEDDALENSKSDNETEGENNVKESTEDNSEHTESETKDNAIDDILFGLDEPTENLPEIVVPTDAKQNLETDLKETQDEFDLDEFLPENQKSTASKDSPKSNLKDLISEFDDINSCEKESGPNEKEDPILDEFDAGFASLAHESITKAKDKELEDICAALEDDDPFDTSHISQVLGNENLEKDIDPFEITQANQSNNSSAKVPNRPPLPLSTPSDLLVEEGEQISDPFDTSIANNINKVDYLKSTENDTDLADTLEPNPTLDELTKSESFDPFDTSVADAFGINELKVLESELIGSSNAQVKSPESDFDFNPREDEEPVKIDESLDLLSAEAGTVEEAILQPQEQDNDDDFDPFDTSIANKIQIQNLEEELLDQVPEKQPLDVDPFDTTIADGINVIDSEGELKDKLSKPNRPPRPVSPACLLATSPINEDINPTLEPLSTNKTHESEETTETDDFDPFDTSIADAYGKTELKALESELLSETNCQINSTSNETLEEVKRLHSRKDSLDLNLKPPRPPSPACLLAATPVDENPTLEPQTNIVDEKSDDFDPFDTSIAQQFGKAEIQVLESELLPVRPLSQLSNSDDFDPRAVTPVLQNEHSIVPEPENIIDQEDPFNTETDSLPCPTKEVINEDFDPFDTSIADKLGSAEIKHLESELLENPNESSNISSIDNLTINISTEPQNSVHCLLAATPTDTSGTLQPITKAEDLTGENGVDDFDPFDTSIANQFGKTEIKELEETLLTGNQSPLKPNNPLQQITGSSDPFDTSGVSGTSSLKRTLSDDEFDPRGEEVKRKNSIKDVIHLLDSTEDSELPDKPLSVLQPNDCNVENSPNDDIDPFDTSIAASIVPGKTELKLLESELLN